MSYKAIERGLLIYSVDGISDIDPRYTDSGVPRSKGSMTCYLS
nr:MAG TPA: hypothetical protein [Caudoviricetes sp.]